MWQRIVTNWTTSVPAVLIAICTGTWLIDVLPDEYDKYGMAVCSLLTALGLLAAKSSNVSNSPNPVASVAVTKERSEQHNPAAVPLPEPIKEPTL